MYVSTVKKEERVTCPCDCLRVLGLFLRVTSSCTIPTYSPTRPSRRNYFGFRRATMASSGVGLYHGLLWSYAHDPAYRRDPDTMGDAAIC